MSRPKPPGAALQASSPEGQNPVQPSRRPIHRASYCCGFGPEPRCTACHGCYSRESTDARREVRERAQVIRGIVGLSEAFFMFMPAPKNTAVVQKLGEIESFFVSDLHQNVSRLVDDKTSQAIDRSPHEARIGSAVAAAWMRLSPTLRALEVAATRGPGRVRYWARFSAPRNRGA